jgi:hypothetical protein
VDYTVTAEDGTSLAWTITIAHQGTTSLVDAKAVTEWFVSDNVMHIGNIEAGSVIQNITIARTVVSESISSGNSATVSLNKGLQLIRISNSIKNEVIKVVGN